MSGGGHLLSEDRGELDVGLELTRGFALGGCVGSEESDRECDQREDKNVGESFSGSFCAKCPDRDSEKGNDCDDRYDQEPGMYSANQLY